MIEWGFTPPPESASGPEGIEDFAAAFREKLTALLSSPRYNGYLLIAAARKLARLKTLLQYAVQRRQEQIKAWGLEAARRKKGQDDGSKSRVELIGALEKIADDELKIIRQAFVQSYRFYKTAMDQNNSSQGGVRTDHYCYPFSIEGVLLNQVNINDLEEMQSHRHEPVFKNASGAICAARFGNTEYKLFIKSGALNSLADTVRKKLTKHLGKECDGFNQAIDELQETLQGYLQRNNLNTGLQLSRINLKNLTKALPHSIRVDGDETLVKYGYGQRFREGRMLSGSFSIIIMMLAKVFLDLKGTYNITIWLMLSLMTFSLIIYFPYAGKNTPQRKRNQSNPRWVN